MRRSAGAAAFLVPLAALAVGPWLGLPVHRGIVTSSSAALPTGVASPFDLLDLRGESAPAASGRTVCNCRSVDVNLNNDVRDAKVKTGDAKVENLNITYVSSDYGDRDVDVDQEAEAISGDAIAGQLIGVDARGPGCVNVRVHATNHVEDAIVESGDATAINRSVILLDPEVSRGDLEIDVEQEAIARSGDAIAGQVLGVIGGNALGGCGGKVDLLAVNEVLDTKVRTGKATFLNDVEIRRCEKAGCEKELKALTGEAEIEMCSGRRCRELDREELADALAAAVARPDDVEETELIDHKEAVVAEQQTCPAASPSPTPAAAPAGEVSDDESTPSPTPEPKTASPSPDTTTPTCAEPSPSPTPEPEKELMATETDGDRGTRS